MKILPINFDKNFKNNISKSGMKTIKPVANDSITFTNRFQKQEYSPEERHYKTALTLLKRANKTKNEAKLILKRGKNLFSDVLKIKKQASGIFSNAKEMIEEYASFGEKEIFTQNKYGQKTSTYRLMDNGNHYIEKLAPKGQVLEQIYMSADKKSCIITKNNPNNPDEKDVWDFKNNKLTRFEQNQTGVFSLYSKKIYSFNDSKSKLEIWSKKDKTPLGKYCYDAEGNIEKYIQYVNGKKSHKDFNFRNNELKNYHDGADDMKSYEEAYYDNSGKCYEAIIFAPDGNEHIKTKYAFDGDGNPSYITRYTQPEEIFVCLVGQAIRME